MKMVGWRSADDRVSPSRRHRASRTGPLALANRTPYGQGAMADDMYAQTRPDTAMVVDDPGSTAAGTGAHPSSEAARRHLMDEASAHAEDGIDPFEAHRRAQGRGPSRIVDQEDEVRHQNGSDAAVQPLLARRPSPAGRPHPGYVQTAPCLVGMRGRGDPVTCGCAH